MRFIARSWLLLLGCAGLLARDGASGPSEALAGVDDKWQRYESAHFEMFSHASDGDSRRLLRRMELLHAVFADFVGAHEKRPNQVTIYCFDSETAFWAYGPPHARDKNVAGFYLRRPDRSVIVVSRAWDDERVQRVIFHEYVHHLATLNGTPPALWFNEGIAEFFSTLVEDGKGLVVGRPIREHVAYLRAHPLMPLAALFAVTVSSEDYNDPDRLKLFYAESWALVHYWYCGNLGLNPTQAAARERFLASGEKGEGSDPVASERLFKQGTGRDYAECLRALEKYLRSGSYMWTKIAAPTIAPTTSYRVAPVTLAEIRRRLAELAFRVNRTPGAKVAMLEAAAQRPPDIRALEILGTDALIDGDQAAAMQRWREAVAAGSTTAGVLQQLAVMEAKPWFGRLDLDFELSPAKSEELRNLLRRSIDCAPNQNEAYEMLAWVEAVSQEPSAANVNLVQRRLAALRQRDRTLIALALVRTRLGDFATAREILDQAGKEAGSTEVKEWCEVVRRHVAAREGARATPP